MKIAVMGAGAIGGYFDGRLAQAGFDLSFIARGAHMATIRENGLKVLSPTRDFPSIRNYIQDFLLDFLFMRL